MSLASLRWDVSLRQRPSTERSTRTTDLLSFCRAVERRQNDTSEGGLALKMARAVRTHISRVEGQNGTRAVRATEKKEGCNSKSSVFCNSGLALLSGPKKDALC